MSVQEIAKKLTSKTIDDLLDAIFLTDKERIELSLATISQSSSPKWMQYRIGRITASISKHVYTRGQTLMLRPQEYASSVIGTIMQYRRVPIQMQVVPRKSFKTAVQTALRTIMGYH